MSDAYDCECPVCGAAPNFSCVTGRNEMRATAHDERRTHAVVLDRDSLRSDLESARRDADRLAARVTELEQDRAYERRISAEMSAERERIRSLLAEACDSLETEGLDETAARLRQQGGAWER